MPPATITISRPAPSLTSQPAPYGPRTLSTSPSAAVARECVTPPRSRMVCSRGPPAAPPLMEIGTSPTPNAPSIVNCPGLKARGTPLAGSSATVTVSWVSARTDSTRNGRGIIGRCRGAGCASALILVTGAPSRGTVHIEQAHPGGLQPVGHHRSEEHTSELQSPCNLV